jgi:hypothetical protein
LHRCDFDVQLDSTLGPISASQRLKGHINASHCAVTETTPPETLPKRVCSTAMKDTSRSDCKTRYEVESDPHRYASLYGDCLILAATRQHCVWLEA